MLVRENTGFDDLPLGELGFSFRKSVKRVTGKAREKIKRVGTKVKARQKRVIHKVTHPKETLKKAIRRAKDPVGTTRELVGKAREEAKGAYKRVTGEIKAGAKKVGRYVKRAAKSLAKHPAVALAIPGIGPMLWAALKARKDPRYAAFIPGVGVLVLASMADNAIGFPVLATAANAINFIIPGVGTAISAGITLAGATMATIEARNAAIKMAKELGQPLTPDETRMFDEEEKLYGEMATGYMDEAYYKAEQYFTDRLGVPRSEWEAMDFDDKVRTIDRAVYDANRSTFESAGITEEDYLKLGIMEQEELLRELGVTTAIVQVPADAEGPGARFLATEKKGFLPYILIGGGVLVAGVILFLLLRRRK